MEALLHAPWNPTLLRHALAEELTLMTPLGSTGRSKDSADERTDSDRKSRRNPEILFRGPRVKVRPCLLLFDQH